MLCYTLSVGVYVQFYMGCRCMCCVVHWVQVYVSCSTPSVGVCVELYTRCWCMCCFVQCVCVCVIQCDGIGRYGTIWALIVDIDG